MNAKRWLLLIVGLTLAIRLILAFTIPNLTYDSYFHLRQVEQIAETGTPLYHDDLSYGGREMRFLPFFHYFMALFSLAFPTLLLAKLLPNILLALLPVIIFLISRKITNNEQAALFSAFVGAFLPILFKTNEFTVEALFLPLMFLAIYSFLNIDQKKHLWIYIISFIILCFTSSATALLIMGFAIYLLLSYIESKKVQKAEVEVILFSLFFFLWSQFIFFKNVLIKEGVDFIWQNVPPQIISHYFPTLSVLQSIILVSVIPFLAGIVMVYLSLFQLKSQRAFLLISLAISTTILGWLRLIEFRLALAFFAVILAVLFGSFYIWIDGYLHKTKIAGLRRILGTGVIVLLALTTVVPAVYLAGQQNTPSDEEIQAFRWLEKNTPPQTRVVGLLEEGHLITYYGKQENVMDNQFSLVKDTEKRFSELNSFYTSPFQTEVLSLAEKLDVSYIMFTPHAQKKYHLSSLKYTGNQCFILVYKDKTEIYAIRCNLERKT